MGNGFIFDNRLNTYNVTERVTGAIITTESDHTSIHKGYGYKGSVMLENLPAGASANYSFKSGDGVYVHFKNIKLNSLGSSVKVDFLKDVDISQNTGQLIPLINQNLNFGDNAKSEFRHHPVYTGGISVSNLVTLADSTNQTIGTATSSMSLYEEIVLVPGDDYVIRISNIGDDLLILAFMSFFFYEEPSGRFL